MRPSDDGEPSDGSDDNDDEHIARYRAQILAEVELSRAELDEIDDHLRSLATDLREHGTPRAEAIALACARLGDPRDLAREHARARSRFGARLSRARAWSAAALLAAPLAYYGHNSLRWGLFTIASLHLALWLGVVIALAAQRTWARALVLGTAATALAMRLLDGVTHGGPPGKLAAAALAMVAINAGVLAFVAPWRRGELARRGLALALLAPAYSAALEALMFAVGAPASIVVVAPVGSLALAVVAIAIIGVARDARWARAAAFAAAFVLGALAIDAAAGMFAHLANGAVLGALGALGAALATRSRRSAVGTIRNAA